MCVSGIRVHILLRWNDFCHPSFETGRRWIQCWWKRAGLWFYRRGSASGTPETVAIGLPPVIFFSHNYGDITDDWCEAPSHVCYVSRWWLMPNTFCQCCRICCVMIERTKNSFIILDSEELAFSHFIGSFRKNSLSGHHAGCVRYRSMWLGREMPWNN